ncbi:hypothetical protein MMC08_006903 [Hypocenomyce scalaris]|nr:hypothetical protein [Hypocenomyce scalaris]
MESYSSPELTPHDAKGDPSWQMLRQATLGDVDFITGDYLAEMNMAENAEAFSEGKHDGFEATAWQGLQESIEVIASKGIKVVINGGALNPKGLAQKTCALIKERGLDLKVAFVTGDDLLPKLGPNVASLKKQLPKHLDSLNAEVTLPSNTETFLKNDSLPLVSANAYIGARAIVQGLRLGADIIIAGRVSDASPVIGAAWYWHSWSDTDYDSLGGALVAGHLIECSAYVTGGNFSGFTEYDLERFIEPGFPTAEIDADGSCVITKHENTGGLVNEDTLKCQLLYELQGNIYLHSDVKAYLDRVEIKSVGKDRVKVSGIVGKPPPPTTKAAIFYRGGYQSQLLLNATGYGTNEKWQVLERQVRQSPKASKIMPDLDVLEFQMQDNPIFRRVGVPEQNPTSQLRSTTYCRLFAEAARPETLMILLSAFSDIALQHFSGFHCALDMRTAFPKSFIAYYPALYAQDSLEEAIILLNTQDQSIETEVSVGHPPKYEPLEKRDDYDTAGPQVLTSFGPTRRMRFGDIALGRSGDKGANINVGIFVRSAKLWEWLRNFLSKERMKELIGEDWTESYWLERVEFANIYAVHFVIYGILGRGVSSSARLDCLGKGFADYIRDKWADVPESLL